MVLLEALIKTIGFVQNKIDVFLKNLVFSFRSLNLVLQQRQSSCNCAVMLLQCDDSSGITLLIVGISKRSRKCCRLNW